VLGVHVASIRYHTDEHTFTYNWRGLWGYEMLFKGQITVHSHDQHVKQVICMQEPQMIV
jgi:hypothetical protein